jgi:hypothetical protein
MALQKPLVFSILGQSIHQSYNFFMLSGVHALSVTLEAWNRIFVFAEVPSMDMNTQRKGFQWLNFDSIFHRKKSSLYAFKINH